MKTTLKFSQLLVVLTLAFVPFASADTCSYLPAASKDALDSKAISKATLKSLRRHNRRCHNLQSYTGLANAYQQYGEATKARKTLASAENILTGGELARLSSHQALLELQAGDVCTASGFYQQAQKHFRSASYQPAVYQRLVRDFEQQRNQNVVSAADINCMVKGARALGVVARVSLQVNFELNSDRINYQGRQQIEQLISAIESQGDNAKLQLVGHTDTTGKASYNQSLSERRAASTARALIQYNPAWRNSVSTSGRGEYEPLARGHSRQDHAINRRVEVVFN